MNSDARFSLREGVLVTAHESGSRFLTDLDSGAMYEMNETGLRILDAAKEGRSLDEIVGTLATHYPEVPAPTLRKDARDLLQALLTQNILVPRG